MLLPPLICPQIAMACWPPDGQDRSHVELTACFIAEYRRCEETVPTFKADASKYFEKFLSDPRTVNITQSKDFERSKRETYNYLVATNWRGGRNCEATLTSLKNGKYP
ncbi:MAG: hypothetical protein FWD50_07705 [Betaproteobacteria bacterium]|nr:hypothetical protein [Betaproteobacteria bacterium]